MIFYLAWYDRRKDDRFAKGEELLAGVGEDDVRKAFSLKSDEYPGDCLEVGEEHLGWLKQVIPHLDVQLDLFEYYVEVAKA
jgi:hypothetical protein